MNYTADAAIPHDDLKEIVEQRGREGWELLHLIEMKVASKDAPSMVTIIWQKKASIPGEGTPDQTQDFVFKNGQWVNAQGQTLEQALL